MSFRISFITSHFQRAPCSSRRSTSRLLWKSSRKTLFAKCTVFCSAHHGGTTLTQVVPRRCQSVRGLCTESGFFFGPRVAFDPLLFRCFFGQARKTVSGPLLSSLSGTVCFGQ